MIAFAAPHARGRLVSGIFLALAAAFCYNLGLAIQKREAQDLPQVDGLSWVTVKAFLSNKGWLGGNGLALLGWVFEFSALLRAPIGLVQPTMAAGIGFLAFLAVRWFHEELGPLEWLGVVGCSTGILLLALSVDPRREQAGRRIDAGALAITLALLCVLAGLGLLWSRRSTRRVELGLGCAAGLLYAGTGLLTKGLGITLVDKHDVLASVVLLILLLGMAFSSLGILQSAYQKGRALVVITLMGVIADFVPVSLSMFVFHEAWPRGRRGIARLVAFAVIAAGFALLARPASKVEEAGHELPEAGSDPVAGETVPAPLAARGGPVRGDAGGAADRAATSGDPERAEA